MAGAIFEHDDNLRGAKTLEDKRIEISGIESPDLLAVHAYWYNADHVEGFGFANAQTFPTMIESRRPVASRTVWLSRKSIKYVSTILRLPLSQDGEAVTNGVAAYHFG